MLIFNRELTDIHLSSKVEIGKLYNYLRYVFYQYRRVIFFVVVSATKIYHIISLWF